MLPHKICGSMGVGLVSLLFGFKGRINRLQYWVGSLGVGVGAVIVLFSVSLALAPQPGASKDAVLTAAPLMLIMMGLVGIVMGWAGMALQVKRFHDRNQPGWLVLLPLLPMFGLMSTVISSALAGHMPAQLFAAAQPYVLALWAINFFFFINLGCLAGTDGPNKYGDPPGSPPTTRSDPSPRGRPQAQAAFSLGSAEAAIERAIAEKARVAPAPAKAARPAVAAAPAAATTGAPASFGRRPSR
jgi:uncharacterized membrane protein YhaH (DUF805 family)